METRVDTRIDTAFGNRLIEEGILTRAALNEAILRAQSRGVSLIELLSDHKDYDSERLYRILSGQLGLQYSDLSDIPFDRELTAQIPVRIANHYQFVPIKITDGKLTVASHYPFSIRVQDELSMELGLAVDQVLASKADVEKTIARFYGMSAGIVDSLVSEKKTSAKEEDLEVNTIATADQLASDASVIKLVNQIILAGFRQRATDIHLEPYRGKFRLRYRIDGELIDANLSTEARRLIKPIISRIKIMSNLDIVEHRLPQDGRTIVQIGEQRLDLRVSSIPTPSGESVVIRVLKPDMAFKLDQIGFSKASIEILSKVIYKPYGMVLMTGPTGSGKTTTLYACLNETKTDSKKIISIEDPIEYEIEGVTQIQVNPKVGLNFADGLRSMLRHDPDTMMVGEIRDKETAEIAIRAALTGHMIFSTLHTNDAPSGVTRLLEIGIEPFLIASSVSMIVAQRLVRLICPHCRMVNKEEDLMIKERIAVDLGIAGDKVVTYRGRGCGECDNSGYRGRTAIHEILPITNTIREKITANINSDVLRQQALSEGMVSLQADGWLKVLSGITTPQEIFRVTNLNASGL